MHKPDFLIIGAAKSATTWLQQSLQANPGIFMPDPELHFFSRHYDDGIDSYWRQFDAAGERMVGEKSNTYLSEPAAAARIARHLPDVSLIAQLRDPVARAYSDYCMLFRRGEVGADIDAHLDPRRAAEGRFLSHGLYSRQIDRFLDLFPPERLLVLFYEDIKADPRNSLDRLARHVGCPEALARPVSERVKDARRPVVPPRLRKILTPLRPVLDPVRHLAPMRMIRAGVARELAYPPLSPDLSARMADFFAEDIARLERLTGRDLSIWPSRGRTRQDAAHV
ncbi:sulfotransferase family protein [Paracoccus fontiphilus]|uniref:Sulfotransferase family protein n=1 Tax=Paracoccus fontiphilus TaxID=1815556 RepID=A0ABV7IGC0_9RHOB|nr:sulfotransferase [Paracoccus fontiphilus]